MARHGGTCVAFDHAPRVAQLGGLDACGSVAACQKRAKASLQDLIHGGAEQAGDEARSNLAGAFRRRIDDVALLRVATS